jgi:hypothetical protein
MRMLAALLVSAAVLVIGGKSYASEADDVKAVVDAYHGALSALDAAKLEELARYPLCLVDG